jgi:hypothetical protein
MFIAELTIGIKITAIVCAILAAVIPLAMAKANL